ncbi:retrovirus-related pol polyprotein from transposon TNT 1-94 [Tanacetum coccineum]
MLLAGSELTKEDRESQLYDEFERFKMLPGENINEYYVRFHKLVNDMRSIRMTMPNIQLNSFVNNMSPEWDRFVTAVELNKGPSSCPIITCPVSSISLLFNKPSNHHISPIPENITKLTPIHSTDELLDQPTKQNGCSLAQILRATLPQDQQTTSPHLTLESSNSQDGRGVVLDVQGRKESESEITMEWQHFDADVDNQPVQDLALNEDNIFQVDECDAFDSDVDDEPTAQSIFMANLSSVGSANPQAGPSNASILSEVHILENAIDHSVSNQDEHEIHNKVQPSDVIDTTSVHMGNSNVIPYEQYLSVNDISGVPSCASSALNSVCVSPVNDAFVPHDPIATELKIYKEQAKKAQPGLYDGDELISSFCAVIKIRAMKAVFENLEAEVDQNETGLTEWSTTLKVNCLTTDPQYTLVFTDRSLFYIGTVRFENDHFGAIMGYGDYVIGDSVISRVYYVEGLGHNLFSVCLGQFCDSDLEVAFRKHTCFVRDLDGVDLIKGSRGTNLYTISVEDMMRSSPICLLSKASKNKSWLWHRHPNHLNFGTLNDLAHKDLVRGLPRLKFEKDHLCSYINLDKSGKLPTNPKTLTPLREFTHLSHGFMWTTKSAEYKWEEIHFVGLNKTIRFVQTDNGTEFVNKNLTDFYESVGITHEKTVPRTPQQNGIVERRNRTLVEAARTMLIFSKASLFL